MWLGDQRLRAPTNSDDAVYAPESQPDSSGTCGYLPDRERFVDVRREVVDAAGLDLR
jgi:hypothetical protein